MTFVNSASNRQVKHSHTHRVTGMQGGWTLTGIVAGVEVDLLVDSGSDVTLLDPAVYNQIKREHKPELTEVNCSLNTASGDRMESFGAADFELMLGQQSWEYPFVVAQMGSIAGILGNDFLRENNCCLDMGLGTLKVNGEVLLLRTERTGSCCRVRLMETIEIPAGHEVCVPGVVDRTRPGENESRCGLVQPAKTFVEQTGVLVSSTLVDPSRKLIPMNLMNIGEETTLVPQGTTVLLMENVSEVAAKDTSGMDEENLIEKGVMLDDCLTPC